MNKHRDSLQELYTFWLFTKIAQKVLRCGTRKRVPNCHTSRFSDVRVYQFRHTPTQLRKNTYHSVTTHPEKINFKNFTQKIYRNPCARDDSVTEAVENSKNHHESLAKIILQLIFSYVNVYDTACNGNVKKALLAL
jgi:hypothetical protein